jgi:uncharacterized membrane protein YccC
VPAVLTGVRTALAITITSVFWIETAWPTGSTAVVIAAVFCSLIASLEKPVTIGLLLVITVLVAAIPVFVTVFYLLPLASDFVSMTAVLAPLLLVCGYIMALPRVGSLALFSVTYFAVVSNIDNVMSYDAAGFFNASIAILLGIGISSAMFAIFFPETPSQASRSFRRQLLRHLSRFSRSRESAFASYAYGLCDQLATTLKRANEEPLAARQCYAMAVTALSTGYAIHRMKEAIAEEGLNPRIRNQLEMLVGRTSKTFLKPSRAKLAKRAWEARALRNLSLMEARASSRVEEVAALGPVLVGCENFRSNLLKARILLPENSDARRN